MALGVVTFDGIMFDVWPDAVAGFSKNSKGSKVPKPKQKSMAKKSDGLPAPFITLDLVPAANVNISAPLKTLTPTQQFFADLEWHELTGKRIRYTSDVFAERVYRFRIVLHALVVNAIEINSAWIESSPSKDDHPKLMDVLHGAHNPAFVTCQFLSALLDGALLNHSSN